MHLSYRHFLCFIVSLTLCVLTLTTPRFGSAQTPDLDSWFQQMTKNLPPELRDQLRSQFQSLPGPQDSSALTRLLQSRTELKKTFPAQGIRRILISGPADLEVSPAWVPDGQIRIDIVAKSDVASESLMGPMLNNITFDAGPDELKVQNLTTDTNCEQVTGPDHKKWAVGACYDVVDLTLPQNAFIEVYVNKQLVTPRLESMSVSLLLDFLDGETENRKLQLIKEFTASQLASVSIGVYDLKNILSEMDSDNDRIEVLKTLLEQPDHQISLPLHNWADLTDSFQTDEGLRRAASYLKIDE